MTKYYLVRHGEPDWSINERYKLKGHGRDLPHLTAKGIAQAREIAKDSRIRNSEIIIASPYTRTMHTAAILSKETGIDLMVEFDLREWQPDLTFQFDSLEELKLLTDDYEAHKGIYPASEVKRWESKAMMKKRMDAVLEKYQDYNHVTVVTHRIIMGTQLEDRNIEHCAVVEMER